MYGLPQQTDRRHAALGRCRARASSCAPGAVRLRARALDEAPPAPDRRSRAARCQPSAPPSSRPPPRGSSEAGYVAIGLDHFALPDDSLAVAHREGRLRRNFQGYTTGRRRGAARLRRLGDRLPAAGLCAERRTDPRYRAAIRAWPPRDGARDQGFRRATARRRAIIERLMCDFAVDLSGSAGRLAAELEALEPFRRGRPASRIDDGLDPGRAARAGR